MTVMNTQDYISLSQDSLRGIYSVKDVELYNNEYLDPFSESLNSPSFSKPSPLVCLEEACTRILQNIHPLPYNRILSGITYKQAENNIHNRSNKSRHGFAARLSNCNWIQCKRKIRSSYNRRNEYQLDLKKLSSVHGALTTSQKRKIIPSKNIRKKLYYRRKKVSSNKTLNTQNSRSKSQSRKMPKSLKIYHNKVNKGNSDYSETLSTFVSNQTQTIQRSVVGENSTLKNEQTNKLSNRHQNCTCNFCYEMQMLNILLTSWSTVINFIHNLQINTIANSNEPHNPENSNDIPKCNNSNISKMKDNNSDQDD
ncbi:unnamed protein product [Trichobilharzia szidati]|nr:unnamed protein product [Trichobilharzia szidati]